MQFFVDAGQPVNDQLVNALIREVIVEKMRSMVGQPTSVDREGRDHAPQISPRPRQRRSPRKVEPEAPPVVCMPC